MSAKPAKASKKEPLTARDLDHATKDLDFGDVAAWPERTGSPMPAIKPVASAARKSIDTAAANEPNALLGPAARELTAKEANQLIREEAKAQKENDRVKARGEGAGVRVLQDAQKRHPNDPKKQVAYFMENFVIKSGTGRPRPVSEGTRTSYSEGLIGAINDLRVERAAISNLGELGRSHLIILTKCWVKAGQSGATIENKISVLRRFLCFWGKAGVIPKGQTLKTLLNQEGMEVDQWRKMVSVESLAWSDKGVDLDATLKQVKNACPITAMQLEVQAAFGLRMAESLHLDPRAADYGDMLRIVHGTKGGLPRDIPFDEEHGTRAWQRDVLERAKLVAAKNRKGQLTRDGYTLKQNKRHFYYVLENAGITRKALGVTAHGLRHEYAARFYTQVSGMPTPVSGSITGAITDQVRNNDLQARRTVSHALGHFRPDVTKAYIGSLPLMEKGRKKLIKDWLDRTEGNATFVQALKDADVAEAWLGGRFAQGWKVEPQEKLRLIVRKGNGGFTPEQLAALIAAISPQFTRAVDLSVHLLPGEPDDALAIFLR